MISTTDVQDLLGHAGVVTDTDGDKIGKIGQVYLDNESGDPQWVTVSTGLFGTSESFVPLQNATIVGDDIQVPFAKKIVTDAPRVEADGEISRDEERELFRYYDLPDADIAPHDSHGHDHDTDRHDHDTDRHDQDKDRDATVSGGDAGTTGTDRRSGGDEVVGRDTPGPATDEAMTRSEERLDVGTETVESGKARLRKYIVTENVTQTIPVSHEEVRIEREPITDANTGDAIAGADLSEEEHEVTLTEEQVVVNKDTVPVERVRLDTDTVTEDQTVTEEVRKEQIDTDRAADQDRRPSDADRRTS